MIKKMDRMFRSIRSEFRRHICFVLNDTSKERERETDIMTFYDYQKNANIRKEDIIHMLNNTTKMDYISMTVDGAFILLMVITLWYLIRMTIYFAYRSSTMMYKMIRMSYDMFTMFAISAFSLFLCVSIYPYTTNIGTVKDHLFLYFGIKDNLASIFFKTVSFLHLGEIVSLIIRKVTEIMI